MTSKLRLGIHQSKPAKKDRIAPLPKPKPAAKPKPKRPGRGR